MASGSQLHPKTPTRAMYTVPESPNLSRQQQPDENEPSRDLESPSWKLTLADFKMERTLGTGTFGRVMLVRLASGTEAQCNRVYALKILRKTEVVRLKQIEHVQNERQILSELVGQPFTAQLQAAFSDRDCLYLLLDYIPGGELRSYLRKTKSRGFNEPTARFYAAEIVLVLEYLHEHQDGVAYRDLKPENLLLDAEGHVKLVDFGFAKRLGEKGQSTTMCGTPEYLAPEVIEKKAHTTAVDWWTLGIVLYEFLIGRVPFYRKDKLEMYKRILEAQVSFPMDRRISEEAKDIIRRFCTVDPSRRLGSLHGAIEVKAHPFFDGVDWYAMYERREPGPIIPPVQYVGDTRCFVKYAEEDISKRAVYTDEMVAMYDHLFKDF